MVVNLFLCAWNGLLFLALLIKVSRAKEDDRYFSQLITLAALINMGGWCVCYALQSIIQFNDLLILNVSDFAIDALYIAFSIIYSVSFVSSYVFVLSMVIASFNGSQFEMKQCKFYSHILLSVILFLLCAIGTSLIYVMPYSFMSQWIHSYWEHLFILLCTCCTSSAYPLYISSSTRT